MPYKTKELHAFNAKKYRDEQRVIALIHYSPGEAPECTCCGELEVKFLCIDHIDGGGTIHRKEMGTSNIVPWLRKNGYPEGFQTLCHNCNMAK